MIFSKGLLYTNVKQIIVSQLRFLIIIMLYATKDNIINSIA